MILVKPSFEILSVMSEGQELSLIEVAGRVCYKSEDKITPTSSQQFCQRLTKLGHESVIEHSAMMVKFIVDRGVSHELVRHRLCAVSQESTRYCNYKGGVTYVIPPWIKLPAGEYDDDFDVDILSPEERTWYIAMVNDEIDYKILLSSWSPQQARSVLPNSLKTEIVVTANFREWRHIFKLRTSKAAHPQMREIMIPLLKEAKQRIPVIFDNIEGE